MQPVAVCQSLRKFGISVVYVFLAFCGETQNGVAGGSRCNFQRGKNQTRMNQKKISLSPEQVYLLVPSVIPASVYSVEPKIQSSEG